MVRLLDTSAGASESICRRPVDAALATALAGPAQRRIALGAALVSVIALAIGAPFAKTPLTPLPAFIPAYEAALVIIDLITAVLLFGQFAQTRSAALLALAAGYLFDALIIVPHALSFPGVMSPAGWLGARMHTTAWLYMFWHGGFPLFIIAYGVIRRHGESLPERLGAWPGVAAVVGVSGLVITLAALATVGHALLPPIMAGDTDTIGQKLAALVVWAITAGGLIALLVKRPYSLLDLWLTVVMVAWLADIALSAVFDAARYDLGFYAGRLYGLLAASCVLAVILIETGGLQRRLAAASAALTEHARDLDDRVHQRTAELARASRELGAVLRASPLAIFMIDPQGLVTLWTNSAERLFGYSEAEALGRPPPHIVDEHSEEFRSHLAAAVANASVGGSYETTRRHRNGALIEVSVRWARVNDDDGRMLGVMYAVADASEHKKLERQLLQAQKMEAVGTLTGGLAHDFNNHLGVIMLNLDVLHEMLDAASEEAELTREALNAAGRGAELIRRLLAFARRQPLQPKRTKLNALIGEITRLLERTLGEEIRITLELDETLWPSTIDPAQLEASLANLATNARDAMPNGGELTIATANRHLDADYASQHPEVTPGDYAMIEVSDSGVGMPPQVLAQAFEPFFTTKPQGRGTGLGLSMVYGFIKQSGGHINVYSEVGVGTTVRLYLPRAGDDRADAGAERPRDLMRGRGQTILAVEDNPGLRRVVVRQLSEIGYRVLAAEDAGAALEVLEREPVALLLTDIVLPGGVSGYDLAETALARWPAIKVVLTSGFPERRLGDNGRLRNLELLTKPYRREDIAHLVGKLFA